MLVLVPDSFHLTLCLDRVDTGSQRSSCLSSKYRPEMVPPERYGRCTPTVSMTVRKKGRRGLENTMTEFGESKDSGKSQRAWKISGCSFCLVLVTFSNVGVLGIAVFGKNLKEVEETTNTTPR